LEIQNWFGNIEDNTFGETHDLQHFVGSYEIADYEHIGVVDVFDDHIAFPEEPRHNIGVLKPRITGVKSDVFDTYS
jgi:hypothetical protein